MKELIPISTSQIGKHPTQSCSARELHGLLRIATRFNDWISRRIEEYGYEEGKDFAVSEFYSSLSNQVSHGGDRRSTEYIISIDMAKELAMVERNDMGRLARRYFIACEKRAMEQFPRLAEELLAMNPLWRDLKRYKQMGLLHIEICKLVGMHKDTVRKHIRRMEACGILAPPPDLGKMQANARQCLLPGLEAH